MRYNAGFEKIIEGCFGLFYRLRPAGEQYVAYC